MNLTRPIVGMFQMVTCCAASLVLSLPSPKDYPANMRVLYLTRTNITAQVNGDFEDVRIQYIKRITFTGTDPKPFADEPKNVLMEKESVIFETVTPRPTVRMPKLTIDQWRELQPPIPPK